jgi:SAM-dependent methyltransferase
MLFAEPVDAGLDPSERELDRARQHGAYRKLICGSGDRIGFDSESLGTVLSNSVLEHIPNLEPVLREVHRVLRPDGRFYATVPSKLFDRYTVAYQLLSGLRLGGPAERYRRFFNRFWRHYHYYDVDGWTRLFERCGFQVEHYQSYCPKKVCLLDDFLAPLCAGNFVCKKLTNRWFLFPGLRRIWARVLARLLDRLVVADRHLEDGGLIFFSLRKAGVPTRWPERRGQHAAQPQAH